MKKIEIQHINPAQKGKMARLKKLLDIIEKEGPLAEEEITARMELNFGFSNQKAREYLRTLEKAGKVMIDDGVVKVV